ncbi:MAG TPA: hypothetical protein VK208_00520 [Pyrinomonadaceae bacterium]|nr:hypothetical protein [Pyrinomonadaceae bacterium]
MQLSSINLVSKFVFRRKRLVMLLAGVLIFAACGNSSNPVGVKSPDRSQIIDGRPYREKTDLVRKGIISEKTYELISDRVIARHN